MAIADPVVPAPLLSVGPDSGLIHRMQHFRELQEAWGCTEHELQRDLLVAALIQLMTGNFDLVLAYLVWRKSLQPRGLGGAIEGIVTVLWPLLFEDDIFCMQCFLELCSRASDVRMAADRFAMESILVERILQSARRGVVMPLNRVIEEFLSLWFQRSHIPDGVESWLARLAYHANTRRKFGVRLRQAWQLHFGSLRVVTPTDPVAGRLKVCT